MVPVRLLTFDVELFFLYFYWYLKPLQYTYV